MPGSCGAGARAEQAAAGDRTMKKKNFSTNLRLSGRSQSVFPVSFFVVGFWQCEVSVEQLQLEAADYAEREPLWAFCSYSMLIAPVGTWEECLPTRTALHTPGAWVPRSQTSDWTKPYLPRPGPAWTTDLRFWESCVFLLVSEAVLR